MENLRVIEDENSGLVFEIQKQPEGIYHARCTTYPQFVYAADCYYGALHGIAKWAHFRKEDSEFYSRKARDAKQLSRQPGL